MIRKSIYTFSFLALFSMTDSIGYSQDLGIVSTSGTTYSHSISSLQSIVFTNGNILVNESGCQAFYYSEMFTQQINFGADAGETNGISSLAESSLVVFPNPATDKLTIERGSADLTQIRVFDLRGTVLMNQEISESAYSLDVSSFNAGVYLLYVDNQIVKFIKQ